MSPPTCFDKRRALLEEPASSYNCHCEEGVARRGNPHPQRCKAPPVPVGDGKRTDCHGPDGPRNDSNLHTLHTKLAAGRYRPPCHCEEGAARRTPGWLLLPFGQFTFWQSVSPKCCHFGCSTAKTVRFWGTDCHGALPLAMTVLFLNAVFEITSTPPEPDPG